MLEKKIVQEVARTLLTEHKRKHAYHPLESPIRNASLEDAYRVQDAFHQSLIEDGRGPIAGYKIALTSKVMQELCGVDQPLAGAIFASTVHESPATLSLSAFQHLAVEFEVAVRLGADLPAGERHTRKSVADAVAACMPAFELIEDRGADYGTIDAFTITADNCWNGGVVLGPPITNWQRFAFESATTRLWVNGEPAGEGAVRDALGHPFEAVAWLANLLNVRGRLLERDMIIMTGSSITTKPASADDTFRFEVEGMGQVSLTLVA